MAAFTKSTCTTVSRMKSVVLFLVVLHVIVFLSTVEAVDKGNFKTCDQSSFCKRNRALEEGSSPFVAMLETFQVSGGVMKVDVMNTKTSVLLQLELHGLLGNMVRMKINEINPAQPRYEVPDVLIAEPTKQSWTVTKQDTNNMEATLTKDISIALSSQPFRVDVIMKGNVVTSVNSRGLMNFEHVRAKNWAQKLEDKDENGEQQDGEPVDEVKEDDDEDLPGMWEETFKSHHDSKPNGPTSIGMDFSFPGYQYVYGIPEHADTMALKTTVNTDPYRLYNLDVFEYELDNPMALYGSVPYMIAHNTAQTIGLFWLNAAETWIDISSNTADKSMFGRVLEFVKGDSEVPQVDTHWFSESGIIDVFFLLGPSSDEVFSQYASLTGNPSLPPLFGIAYHQCRWNYNDEQDVKNVDMNFDEHDIPYDVIWLDIEHTDGKRYMTWDKNKFPNSIEMLDHIAAKGRKMVTIVDPHTKRDSGYKLYQQGKDNDYFVKNKDSNEYEGWCWPGSSSYLDFTRSEVREWWGNMLSPSEYEGTTMDLFTWNDMNEPSVFNGPEVTMHKDAIHGGGWEHRDVHNIFGLYVHKATADGQIKRSDGKERPFVLSRAFFAGSQRYGAIWTGDNMAEWSHLKASIPMLLSISLAGIPFIGADVGGFFRNPDSELLTRWYQAGAYQPFFRAHAHLDSKRREPWLLPANNMAAIRKVIRERYALLPYWYTLFYRAHKTGIPVMRPMWVEFPSDEKTFDMEDQYMIGDALLVKPVTTAGTTHQTTYLPGEDVWYDLATYNKLKGPSSHTATAALDQIPVYQRGGTIIPRKERVRRSSSLTLDDPYTLTVALDNQGLARGNLFIDDGHSFDYQAGNMLYRNFNFLNNVLQSRTIDYNVKFTTRSWLERVVIVGLKTKPNAVELSGTLIDYQKLDFTYTPQSQSLVIRKPGVNMGEDWKITLS
ncbi:neutral alpha-glucosidase AB-like isoform X2 [Amphiura filiformis]|uniref:neutral alpha-glucosidase AB-like isoform X2 n=1 Tax=Amphiura filiformis TaxID=82378 RepID=UPI003B21CF22